MASFHIQSSGTIRLHVTINSKRHRVSTKYTVGKWDKEEQRAYGKGTSLINQDLDRIEKEVGQWVKKTPTHFYSFDQVEEKLRQIILNTKIIEARKSISDYFYDFRKEKETEVNTKTKKLLTSETIRSYQTGFEWYRRFGMPELELVTKSNYHKFLSFMLNELNETTAGKYIKRLKSFFIWCDKSGLPINNQYKFWVPIGEGEAEDDSEKALNSEQLNRLYNLKVDPLDIFVLARELHGKNLDVRHSQQLAKSVDEARKQAIAIASIGPHKESFWKLTNKNIKNGVIRYRRNKNNQICVAPAIDNDIFHALEFANLKGGRLFKRITSINYYLTYVKELCDLPFHITAKTFRKTFGSIIWNELDHPNKMGIIMKAYGHKNESVTRRYLGIQDEDLRRDHTELFSKKLL